MISAKDESAARKGLIMSFWKRMFGGKDQDISNAGSDGAAAIPPGHTPPSTAGAVNPLMRSPDKSSGPAAVSKSDPLSAAKDRVVRVFVSSTFKDMIEDRNELMAQVWPALRRVCRGRSVEFVEVDLRWGVTEEQSQRKDTLRHCLAEIKRCRPYFIGLLGERYGWTPGQEAYSQALLDEEDWLKDEVAKHSVTELEILHGVLRDPEMAKRSFFYFRDPQYAASKGGDYLPEDTVRPTRQDALKQKVKAVCVAKRIPLRENYADPRALAALVLNDLTAAIDAEFPPDQVPDVWSREDRDHEAYAKSRRTDFYVGRDAYFNQLDTYADNGAQGCGLTVLGASGGGKSALLANWVARRRQAHPGDFVFQHYIGSSAMSAGHLALMRRLMVAIVRWCGADDPAGPRGLEEEEKKIPAKAEEIVKVFPDYLSRLTAEARRKGVGAVLALDALNQLEDRERGRLLAWVPHRLPGDLRLVVSTLPGDTLDALQPRGWPALIVEPLMAEERVRLIARYLTHFAQGLSDARAKKIAAVPAASNPLYIKTLLDDLRATGDHLKLDEQIDDYLRAADIPALFDKILSRFERDYERDRPGLVREALSLLWTARRGLTEPELLEALKPEDKASLPAALWSPVRCALEDGLVDRDVVLAFAHEHLRTAVERRYTAKPETVRALRLLLADLFEARPVDARQADELPWLLRQTEARDRLRACLLDIDRFLFMHMRNENELLGYWVWLKEERGMGQPYLQAFQQWAEDKEESASVSYAANQLALFLADGADLHADAEPLMRHALKIDETSGGENHPRVANCLSNLAALLLETNRFAEAEPLMRRALKIDETSFGENHPKVAIRLNNLAVLLKATDRLAEAEPLMRRALKINETSGSENHPRVAIDLNNLAQLLKATNRLADAEPLMWRALKISEQSYGENHPNVATQLSNLSVLLQETDRLAEAEPLIRRALKIDETSFGENHPKVAIRLNNLAQLLQATNRLADAEPLMRRALGIDERSYGENHPKVAIRLNNLAQLLQATNRFAEAEPLIRRALKISEQSYGENHPNVAINLNNLAALLQETNRLAEAEPLMRRALKIDETSYGENHPNVAIRLNNLAQLLQATNRLAEAEPLMRRALGICETSLGSEHPNVATQLNNLAALLKATDRLAEAEPLMRRALGIDERSYGENHPDVAIDLNNLAALLKATDRLAEAEPLMRRALKIDETSYGENHPSVSRDLANQVVLLLDTNRRADAEPLMRRMVEIFLKFTRATGHPHPHLQATVGNYASLLRAMGKPEDEIRGTLADLAGRYGMTLGGAGGKPGTDPSPKLRAVLEEIMRDQTKLQEIAARLRRDDPALFQELLAFIQSQQRK